MPVLFWVWVGIFAFLILAIVVLELIEFGMDLGIGYCDNFVDWIKKKYKFHKEWNEEQRAIKAFLKANPLCRECQQSGKYRKAEFCNRDGNDLIPVCKEHHASTIK